MGELVVGKLIVANLASGDPTRAALPILHFTVGCQTDKIVMRNDPATGKASRRDRDRRTHKCWSNSILRAGYRIVLSEAWPEIRRAFTRVDELSSNVELWLKRDRRCVS